MTLRHAYENKFLASVNVMGRECATSDSFSSCELSGRSYSGTKLKTLVMGLDEGEERTLECELNTIKSKAESEFKTLRVVVRGSSE